MKYRIEPAATAKADIRGQAQWLREQVSPAAADEWLAGLYKTSPREFDRQAQVQRLAPLVMICKFHFIRQSKISPLTGHNSRLQ